MHFDNEMVGSKVYLCRLLFGGGLRKRGMGNCFMGPACTMYGEAGKVAQCYGHEGCLFWQKDKAADNFEFLIGIYK